MSERALQLAAANFAARWAALAERLGDEVVRVEGAVCVRSRSLPDRGVVLDRGAAAAEVAGACAGERPALVEDPFSVLDLGPLGFTVESRMDVMVRPPTPAPVPRGDVEVEVVGDPDALALAERAVVEGFPIPAQPGTLLPPQLLSVPGATVWLARRAGAVAGAVTAHDDGATLGIYFLATLPQHRGCGIGTALLRAAHASAPARPAVLTATAAGAPLYAACGYSVVGRATWWRRSRTAH